MAQHFLLSKDARTFSLRTAMRLTDEEAYRILKQVRWAENNGQPFCHHCGCVDPYEYQSRPIFKCRGCRKQFGVLSGTIFAKRKKSLSEIVAAIAMFMDDAAGISALRLSRSMGWSYKTAFVFLHKLREALIAEKRDMKLQGEVEIDGLELRRKIKKPNEHGKEGKTGKKDARLKENRPEQSSWIVTMRQRKGRTLPFLFKHESDAIPTVVERVHPNSKVFSDNASHWGQLHARFEVHSVNHSVQFSNYGGKHTNLAESFNSRFRRMQRGRHLHITEKHATAYAHDAAIREDTRRLSDGGALNVVLWIALTQPATKKWLGYWRGRPHG